MAVNRIAVTLEQSEYAGLLEIAVTELRSPQDQLRHILRQELQRRDLLHSTRDARGQQQEAAND